MNTAQFNMIGSLLFMLVTIASIVITYRKSRKRPAPAKARTPETLVEEIPALDPNSLSPSALQQDMDSRSANQMAELNDIYQGQSLHWLVIFKERKPAPDGEWLRFLEENTIINLTCEIDPTQFPEANHWRTNEHVWIRGTIENVSEGTIRLTDVSFS